MAKKTIDEKNIKLKKKSKVAGFFLAVMIILILLAAAYTAIAYYFGTHFYPSTKINGEDYSMKSPAAVEEALGESAGAYILSVHDREDRVKYISADQIDYKYVFDGSIKAILREQESLFWPLYIRDGQDHSVRISAEYDEDKLLAEIDSMECFKPENIVEPADAYVENTGSGFEIIPEVEGNKPVKEKIILDIQNAIDERATVINLEGDDYASPAVRSDDPNLVKKVELSDKIKKLKISYDVHGIAQMLDGNTIISWVSIGDDMKIKVNEELVTAYVQQLASAFNTYAKEREFKTSSGDSITIGGGDYGWIIDKDAEKKQLIKDIEAMENVSREPCYTQTAFAKGEDDISDTYIEIDYTKQHMYFYKKGKLVVEGDIVSGNTTVGNGSPDGVFKVIDRKTNTTLVGEDYASDVEFFMPFAYNVGLHDASWRSSFGGEIYKSGGSHGCVNLPYDVAKKLFDSVEVGTPVIAYYRESVSLKSNNAKVSNAYSYSK